MRIAVSVGPLRFVHAGHVSVVDMPILRFRGRVHSHAHVHGNVVVHARVRVNGLRGRGCSYLSGYGVNGYDFRRRDRCDGCELCGHEHGYL